MPKQRRPAWWIHFPRSSWVVFIDHYYEMQREAVRAFNTIVDTGFVPSETTTASEIPGTVTEEKAPEVSEDSLRYFTNPENWADVEHPMAFHAALRAAHSKGKEATLRAVGAAAWVEAAALILSFNGKPLTPLESALKEVSDGASDDQIRDAMKCGVTDAYGQRVDRCKSLLPVKAAFDIWLHHILGKPQRTDSAFGKLDGHKYFGILSVQPAQTIDRAARSELGWRKIEEGVPLYDDRNNDHRVEYFSDDVPLEVLWDEVRKLDPRTADAWRLITAATLKAWPSTQSEPPTIWISVPELAQAMGYEKAKSGGFKPEHLDKVARALIDLERFHITVPLGSKIVPINPKTGKRMATKLEAQRRYKALVVFAQEEMRDLAGYTYPMRWHVRVGEWINDYSPRTFAPLYRALVELPVKSGVPLWTKSLGTELCLQFRQDRNRSAQKTLKVKTLLTRACLIQQAIGSKDRARSRDYFEEALNELTEIGVCTSWAYESDGIAQIDDLNASQRGWFERWLEVRVIVSAPLNIVQALPELSNLPHP